MPPGPLPSLTHPVPWRRCSSPLWPGAPIAWGLLFILAQKSFRVCVRGAGGKGQLLSLRQKDAGQHFIHNHLNVFAVIRIWNPGWGAWGSGVRRVHLSGRLHVSGEPGSVSRQLLWESMTTSPDCCLGAQRGCPGVCATTGPRFVPGQFRPMRPLLSDLLCPLPTHLVRASAHF